MTQITIHATVKRPIERVWECWTKPEHITKWNFASDDWECPVAKNDLRVGGSLTSTMAAKDGSTQFEFTGIYDIVEEHKEIQFTMEDGRKVQIAFEETKEGVLIAETFDAETENSEEMQRQGWQAILNNFKKYVENN